MKLKRWICLLLILMLTVTLVTGCKTAPDMEDGATAEDWVGVVEDDDKDEKPSDKDEKPSDKDEKPSDKDENPSDKDETPSDKDENPSDKDENPSNKDENPSDKGENPSDKDENPSNKDETPSDGNDGPTEWVPVKKESSGVPVTFMMQNIFHGGDSDYSISTNQKALGNRLARFKSMVQANDPDIIFVQESRTGQISFFSEDSYMSQVYDLMYQYRAPHMPNDGGMQSEPVMWKKSKFECLDKGNFWLSETPDRFSTSFNSSSSTGHNCNWAKLKEKSTGLVMYVYCVHIDPYGTECQYESMQLYYKKAALAKDGEYVFFGGDYNCRYRTNTGAGGGSYTRMMDDWSKVCDFRDAAMYLYGDGLCELGGMASSINVGYSTGDLPAATTSDEQIDYLMGKPMPNMCVDYYGFDYTVYENKEMGVPKGHISDHWGLVVKMRLDTDADYSQYYREPYEYENDQYYFNAGVKG